MLIGVERDIGSLPELARLADHEGLKWNDGMTIQCFYLSVRHPGIKYQLSQHTATTNNVNQPHRSNSLF